MEIIVNKKDAIIELRRIGAYKINKEGEDGIVILE